MEEKIWDSVSEKLGMLKVKGINRALGPGVRVAIQLSILEFGGERRGPGTNTGPSCGKLVLGMTRTLYL